jgi:alpha-aminoadipate carrier protein LysW
MEMVNCPNCDAVIDVDEDELDEGDTLTCDECGADLSVTGLDPLELETEEDEDEEEEEEEETDPENPENPPEPGSTPNVTPSNGQQTNPS